jgi:hypothetical protein
MEIKLPKGTLRISGSVDVVALRAVLECLVGCRTAGTFVALAVGRASAVVELSVLGIAFRVVVLAPVPHRWGTPQGANSPSRLPGSFVCASEMSPIGDSR